MHKLLAFRPEGVLFEYKCLKCGYVLRKMKDGARANV